jgi:hypothetical protein
MNKKETVRLTLKGIIGHEMWDKVELYAYRVGCNGIILKEGGCFVEIEKVPEKKANKRKSK